MTRRVSHRVANIVQAEIRSMSVECEKRGGINLAQGVCDTELPAAIRAQACLGIEQGMNSYSRHEGLGILREAIARKAKSFNGISVDPESEVVVSAGSTGAFYCTCLALLDPGDEVILFEPYYGYHVNTLLAIGAVPRYIPLTPPAWTFCPDDLERAITPRTKAIVLNTPANPSGKVFADAELTAIARLATRDDLFVITDEIYEHFVYDGLVHRSIAALPNMYGRTITISGFSKTFSMTGWRIGYCFGASEWMESIGYVNDLIYVCAPTPLQYGVAMGMSQLEASYYQTTLQEFALKRDRLCTALGKAQLAPYRPQGAYYILADISRLPGADAKEKTLALLDRTGVAAVPGDAFYYHQPERHLARFCFAKPDRELEEACERLLLLA